jgi:uncharacterized membrane protein
MDGSPTESERSVDRLIFLTDAVVAIAITLLILPLVEIVTADAARHPAVPVPTFIDDNLSQMFAFVLSFAIIARLWIANHELLIDTARATVVLMWLDLAWAFSIVVIPLPTEITAAYKQTPLTVAIYIGSGFFSMLLLAATSWYLYRHPQLQKRGHALSATELWGIGSSCVGFGLALALCLIFPILNYYSLLVLVLTFPLDLIVKPRIRARERAVAAHKEAQHR